MFKKTSDAITKKLKENNTINDEQYKICQYGLQQGFTIILNVITTLALGIILGMLFYAVVFTLLYVPLRSNAGGYHAKTASRCYLYSILLMVAVLLAIKHIVIPSVIGIIVFISSIAVISMLAPVENTNKPLDEIEIKVYHKRTLLILTIESFVFILSLVLNWKYFMYTIIWVVITMGIILLIGKYCEMFN